MICHELKTFLNLFFHDNWHGFELAHVNVYFNISCTMHSVLNKTYLHGRRLLTESCRWHGRATGSSADIWRESKVRLWSMHHSCHWMNRNGWCRQSCGCCCTQILRKNLFGKVQRNLVLHFLFLKYPENTKINIIWWNYNASIQAQITVFKTNCNGLQETKSTYFLKWAGNAPLTQVPICSVTRTRTCESANVMRQIWT